MAYIKEEEFDLPRWSQPGAGGMGSLNSLGGGGGMAGIGLSGMGGGVGGGHHHAHSGGSIHPLDLAAPSQQQQQPLSTHHTGGSGQYNMYSSPPSSAQMAPPPPPPASLVAGAGNTTPGRYSSSGSSSNLPATLSPGGGGSNAASRQTRLAQLLDSDLGGSPTSYNNTGSSAYLQQSPNQPHLSRSTSLSTATLAARAAGGGRGGRRAQDDLEGAFHDDAPDRDISMGSVYNTPGNVYYSPALAGSTQPPPPSNNNNQDPYSSDSYFTPGGGGGQTNPGLTPRRANTHRDPNTSSSRQNLNQPISPAAGHTPLDPYSPQQQQTLNSSQSSGGGGGTSTLYSSYYNPPPPPPGGPGSGRATQVPSSPYSSSAQHSRSASRVHDPSSAGSPLGFQSSTAQYATYNSNAMDLSTSPHPPLGLPQHQQSTHSLSTPSTPLSHAHTYHSYSGGGGYYGDAHAMSVDTAPPPPPPPPRRRTEGFRRVREARDLQPRIVQTAHRRVDVSGEPLSPLKQLTTQLVETYRVCNPAFRYESSHNPRRVLTKPSKAAHNDGYDNEDYDYILYVNDILGSEEKDRYVILDILGQGTFGQVVKCQNIKTHEVVAVKVVKNKPAYFNQSMMEVTILDLLNKECDPDDEHHILRLRDSFIHKQHLCLVFELLSSNLYELIKQNQFQGLSIQLVKVFTSQLLDALTVLKEARLIHCDLKPENILLKSLQSPQIKVIDFGSACHERQTVYTYIQSRFYRSPEVLLGIPYTAAIDMWSLGCIAVELFLGLPLFPGTSEYNQITRIVEMLGLPPQHMLDRGKQTNQFFDAFQDHYGQKTHGLKSLEKYSREHNTNEQPGKQYFNGKSLVEIVNNTPMPPFKSSRQAQETEKELNQRQSFLDFCTGLLNMDPLHRWTPQQARMHPFITGEKWTKPWQPTHVTIPQITMPQPQATPSPNIITDPKRPYGGLVPSQPKGQRAYSDAATYNQHLAQHQAYTAQAAAASQAASQQVRNPYLAQQAQQSPQQGSGQGGQGQGPAYVSPEKPASAYTAAHHSQSQQVQAQYLAQQQQQQQQTAGQQAYQRTAAYVAGQQAQQQQAQQQPGLSSSASAGYLGPNPPSQAYTGGGAGGGSGRTRSNTINQIDTIPPALARLQHMTHDAIGGRNALTPVMNRGEDAYQEWERRRSGKAPPTDPAAAFPPLQFLHQQAELAAAQGMTNWASHSTGPIMQQQQQHHLQGGQRGYAQPSKLAHVYSTPGIKVEEQDDVSRRDAIMSAARSAARTEPPPGAGAVLASPPQVYASGGGGGGQRYATQGYAPPQQQADVSMYTPLQPDSYARGGPQPPPPVAQGGQQQQQQSFYGPGIPGGQQGNGMQGQQRKAEPWAR